MFQRAPEDAREDDAAFDAERNKPEQPAQPMVKSTV